MISFLEGRLIEKGAGRVVVSVGGVGYEVSVPAQTLAKLPPQGRPARLYTRMQVRDDAMLLFGFASQDERSLFDHLITVTSVGPKMAMAILSALSPDAQPEVDELLNATVDPGTIASLQATVKLAIDRTLEVALSFELGNVVASGGDEAATGPLAEVREALLSLGLSPQEARDALESIPPNGDRPVEEILRQALRSVGR